MITNNAKFGFIIAAGNQTRYKITTPKALLKLSDGRCILDINYKALKSICDVVFVVCSNNNHTWFDDSKYNKIIVESGLGSGDAILSTFIKLFSNPSNCHDSCLIIWGDAIINDQLLRYTVDNANMYDSCTIPCLYEDNPYVQILATESGKTQVKFSKFNDEISNGYHDMSVFFGQVNNIYDGMKKFYTLFYSCSEHRYHHPHGCEYEFLDTFNDVDGFTANIIPIDSSIRSYSFNTIDEANAIIAELDS